ncbi:MAG TPA: ABC transporter ATP-binding protein, partial [Candidatus Acetothermia bacterium]|nr:ABC transporter ATP-binding protein [Candidatus Acetothermia bacterium]
MVSQHNTHDDNVMGKAFDARLMRRLMHFLKPYWKMFSVCVLLILVLTGIQTVLPYITKIAIDDFLTLPWAVVTLDSSPSVGKPIALADGRYLIRTNEVPSDMRKTWELSGALSAKRYLFVPQGSAQEAVASRYPQVFTPAPGGSFASEEALRALPAADTIVLRQGAITGVIRLAILFAIALIIRFLFGVGQVYLLQLTGQKVMYDMRRQIFAHVLRLPLSYFDSTPVGRLVTRVTNDVA